MRWDASGMHSFSSLEPLLHYIVSEWMLSWLYIQRAVMY